MSTIKIKRSASTGSPANLGQGEVAYSFLSGTQSNGGDRFYIGTGTETGGNAANLDVVGGKYFTDMMDHVTGTLTASSALLVDSNKKIDEFFVDDLKLDGSTLSSTGTNTNITLDPSGTGKVQINSNATITGDLTVEGTTTSVNSTTVEIADPQFELASTNNNDGSNGVTTDAVDFGTYGNFNTDPSGSNTTGYAGWFRDASDSGKLKWYTGLTAEPTTTVNTSHSSFGLATLVAGTFEGAFTGNLTGNASGNAATATALASARAIALSGDVVGTANFDGTSGISISTTIQANSVALGTDTTGNFMSDVGVTSGTGLSVSHSAGEGSTATFAGIDATNSVKGVASFASSNFGVSSGAVSISAIDGGTY